MFENLEVLNLAMGMARHSGRAQAASAQNLANADTPGYAAIDIPEFEETLSRPPGHQKATRATHLNGYQAQEEPFEARIRDPEDPNGNTVSLELEMLNAAQALRKHSNAMAVYRSSMKILRTSINTQ